MKEIGLIKKRLQKERNNIKACSLLLKCKQEDTVLLNGGLVGRRIGREEGRGSGKAE